MRIVLILSYLYLCFAAGYLGREAYDAYVKVPREHPLWCHMPDDIMLSGPCSKVPGLQWSI